MGVATWALSWKHSIIFQNPASSTPPPSGTYVAENGTDIYVAEDGVSPYVTET
jgi:hypothetical protein